MIVQLMEQCKISYVSILLFDPQGTVFIGSSNPGQNSRENIVKRFIPRHAFQMNTRIFHLPSSPP